MILEDEVRTKYTNLFRTKLDPEGRPVAFPRFRLYMIEYLDELDPDPEAQLMILEQFVAEAYAARQAIIFPGVGEIDSPPEKPDGDVEVFELDPQHSTDA